MYDSDTVRHGNLSGSLKYCFTLFINEGGPLSRLGPTLGFSVAFLAFLRWLTAQAPSRTEPINDC